MYPTVVQFNIMQALTSLTVTEATTSIYFNNGSEKAFVFLIDQNIHVSILTTDVSSSHASDNALPYSVEVT